jgi:transcriptional regulator with PAS, ATPase and Fis domain
MAFKRKKGIAKTEKMQKIGVVRPVTSKGYPNWKEESLEKFAAKYRGPRETLIDCVRRLVVHEILWRHGGNNTRAANDLGIIDRMVAYWRSKYRI